MTLRDKTKTTAKLKGKGRGSKGVPVKAEDRPLTNKQRVFVEEYLECWNGAEAARRAGYTGDNLTHAIIASQNLVKLNIAKYVKERIADKAMSADEVLARLGMIARGSLKPFVQTIGGDDAFAWPDLATEDAQENFGLLKKIKPKKRQGGQPGNEYLETEVELEILDPLKALELLGRHHKLFTDKTDLTSSDGSMTPVGFQFIPAPANDSTDSNDT